MIWNIECKIFRLNSSSKYVCWRALRILVAIHNKQPNGHRSNGTGQSWEPHMNVAINYEVHDLFDKHRSVMLSIPVSYFCGQHTHGYKQILRGLINTKVWCSTCRLETTKSQHVVTLPVLLHLLLLQYSPNVSETSSASSSNDQGAPPS